MLRFVARVLTCELSTAMIGMWEELLIQINFELLILITNKLQFILNSIMGLIADRFKKQLQELKIKCDKNDELIGDAFELLSECKRTFNELDSIANQIESELQSGTI